MIKIIIWHLYCFSLKKSLNVSVCRCQQHILAWGWNLPAVSAEPRWSSQMPDTPFSTSFYLIGSGGSEPRAFQPGTALTLQSLKSILQIIKNKQYTVFMRRKERKELFNLGHFVALISQLKGEPCSVTHFCLCEVCRQSRWPLLGQT